VFQSLHHASITTGDVDRLAAFYETHFGFARVHHGEWDGGAPVADAIYSLRDTSVRMVMLRLGNTFLELFEFRRPMRTRGDDRAVAVPGLTHIAVITDDIDADYERLLAAGVTFHCPPQTAPGLCRATYARDPDGNIVELLQPEPGASFDPGLPAKL
jgi:catechol 2,3-dioxygenase-like lactoylglutathione lyase family enzyme